MLGKAYFIRPKFGEFIYEVFQISLLSVNAGPSYFTQKFLNFLISLRETHPTISYLSHLIMGFTFILMKLSFTMRTLHLNFK